MQWKDVGRWLKDNAASSAALVGSLLTGNVPAAVAAGVALVSSATGSADPGKALEQLQADPATLVKLRELVNENEASIRGHIERMAMAEMQDIQAEHHETQETIRASDKAQDQFVRRTRPGQSWVSLAAAIAYVFAQPDPDIWVLGALLTLPLAYAGLRTGDKGFMALVARRGKP
jgi:hypothetical protein